MKETKIRAEIDGITKKNDEEMVRKVCGTLVEDYRRGKLGYCPRSNLDLINEVGKGENELRDKMESWVNGFFGLRSQDKIAFLEKMVQVGQEKV